MPVLIKSLRTDLASLGELGQGDFCAAVTIPRIAERETLRNLHAAFDWRCLFDYCCCFLSLHVMLSSGLKHVLARPGMSWHVLAQYVPHFLQPRAQNYCMSGQNNGFKLAAIVGHQPDDLAAGGAGHCMRSTAHLRPAAQKSLER
eukprot:1161379-Pelagomonas_calceolata.AAC.5